MKHTVTNILLFGILVCLALSLLKQDVKPVVARPAAITECITFDPGDPPEAYLHVVTHVSSEDRAAEEAKERAEREERVKEMKEKMRVK